MDDYPQIISMQGHTKKLLFLIPIISVFSLITLFGINYTEVSLSSLSSIIMAWVTINPLEINVSAPLETEVGKVFEVKARVINKGEEKIEDGEGEIFPPEGLILIQKEAVREIGVIPGKKEKKITWQIQGEEIGSYIISVKVSGELKGQIISAEGNTLVEIKESLRKTRPRDWFQNLSDFFQKLFGI